MERSESDSSPTEAGNIDYRELTAPCGLDCFNCPLYLANNDDGIRKHVASQLAEDFGIAYQAAYNKATCQGCRTIKGKCMGRKKPCKVYQCVSLKGIATCADCSDFPCDNLHPYADMASRLPHNTKVYNLALIRKMGMEKWAQEKAKSVKETYFGGKFNL